MVNIASHGESKKNNLTPIVKPTKEISTSIALMMEIAQRLEILKILHPVPLRTVEMEELFKLRVKSLLNMLNRI